MADVYRPNTDFTLADEVSAASGKKAFVQRVVTGSVSGSTFTPGGGGTAASPTIVQQTSSAPTAGTNLSGTVTTTSGGFNLAASATRKPGDVQGQNVGANNIGFNEFGGTAVIGAAGTYTVIPGATFSITTNALVNFIAATGNTAVTITGI